MKVKNKAEIRFSFKKYLLKKPYDVDVGRKGEVDKLNCNIFIIILVLSFITNTSLTDSR